MPGWKELKRYCDRDGWCTDSISCVHLADTGNIIVPVRVSMVVPPEMPVGDQNDDHCLLIIIDAQIRQTLSAKEILDHRS